MQFIYLFAAGGLMKSVNILSDNCRELTGRFQSSKRQVGRPGLCVRIQHSFPVEPEKTGGILLKIGMTEDDFGRYVIFLMIETVFTSEVGNTAFG